MVARPRKGPRHYRKGPGGRYYADFRDYADVGGGLEPLRPEGQSLATPDQDVAAILVADRLQELERFRRGIQVADIQEGMRLKEYAAHHLLLKEDEDTSSRHLKMLQGQLQAAVDHFGSERDLRSIKPGDVGRWIQKLKTRGNGRGGKLSPATQRKYLNALSDLYARAVSDGIADTNPARDLYTKAKPKAKKVRARYWHPYEVALLLESARTLPVESAHGGRGGGGGVTADRYPWIHPLLATAAYTGLRKSELFGLLVDDVSFKLGIIRVRPNEFRTLKTEDSERDVPIWPELETVLREYLLRREREAPLGALLFPSHRHTEEKMLDNVDRMLDRIGARVGIPKPRLHAFRHSYTAARMQTLEHGAPIHEWQVARELGHQSPAMIHARYGHLARVKERSETVRYSVENVPDDAESDAQARWEALVQGSAQVG